MNWNDLLPWLNLLLPVIFGYVINIERRLTRLEALREADESNESREAAHQLWLHRRSSDK